MHRSRFCLILVKSFLRIELTFDDVQWQTGLRLLNFQRQFFERFPLPPFEPTLVQSKDLFVDEVKPIRLGRKKNVNVEKVDDVLILNF